MKKIKKSSAAYELSDELTALRRLNRLSRDVAGDIFSRLSDTSDRASGSDELTSLIGIFSGAICESGWKLEVLLELLCALDSKLAQLETMAEQAADDEDINTANLSSDQLEAALSVLTGKKEVSSKKLCALLRDLDSIREA